MAMRVRDGEAGYEQTFEVFLNGTSETIPDGAPVELDTSVNDGVYVRKPTAAGLSLLVGVADEDAPPGEYFRVQTRGFRKTGALVRGAVAVAAGDILIPEAGEWRFVKGAASEGMKGLVVATEAQTSSSTELRKVLIRAK